MYKTLTGKVVSVKMNDTIVVEVYRKKPHPMYKKLLKRSKKYKVSLDGKTVSLGNAVVIEETRPTAKRKTFRILNVVGESRKGDK